MITKYFAKYIFNPSFLTRSQCLEGQVRFDAMLSKLNAENLSTYKKKDNVGMMKRFNTQSEINIFQCYAKYRYICSKISSGDDQR